MTLTLLCYFVETVIFPGNWCTAAGDSCDLQWGNAPLLAAVEVLIYTVEWVSDDGVR